jgi:hypothetical protein
MSEQAVMDPPKEEAKTAQQANAEYNESVADRERRQSIMKRHAKSATIYRVGYLNAKTHIRYSIIENNKNNEFFLSSDDTPCESFLNSLHALAPHVSCLINKDEGERKWQAMQMTIKSVTFKYHENNNIHAGICVTRELDSGHCFTFNTPMIPLESSDHTVAALGKEMAEVLRALIDEAKAYIGGKRSQGTLPFPEDDEFDAEWEEEGGEGEE